jgi:hypothetical protein
VSILEQHYDPYNVTVTVEWTYQVGVIMYDIRVSPLAPITTGIHLCEIYVKYV